MKMKTLLTLVVLAMLTSIAYCQPPDVRTPVLSIVQAFELKETSARIDGLSADLAGIVLDEFTDMHIAPYDILNIKGKRLYTNLSNYVNGSEEQFGAFPADRGPGAENGTYSADQYLIGLVYPVENIGSFGLFYRQEVDKSESTETGSTPTDTVITFAPDTGNPTETTGRWWGSTRTDYANGTTATRTASSSETKSWAIPFIYGRKISDQLSFGIRIADESEEVDSASSSVTNSYSQTRVVTDVWAVGTTERGIDNTVTTTVDSNIIDNSASSSKYSEWNLTPAVKFEINPDFAIGAQVRIGFPDEKISQVSSSTDFTRNVLSDTDTTLTNTVISATSIDNSMSSSSLSGDLDGTAWGLGVQSWYRLSDVVRLRGAIDYRKTPLSGPVAFGESSETDSLTNTIEAGYQTLQNGGSWTQSGDTTISIASGTGTADDDRSGFGIGLGGEWQVNEKLMFAAGIKYDHSKRDFDANGAWTGSVSNFSGSTSITQTSSTTAPTVGGTASSYPRVASTGTFSQKYEETVNTIILPVGLEYTLTDWLQFRIGASHRLTKTKAETTDVSAETETTTPDSSGTTSVGKSNPSSTDKSESTDSGTTYYYGAGLKVTENLDIDLLGWRRLTDLTNWKLSATLKF
jgi:hypothetical protein